MAGAALAVLAGMVGYVGHLRLDRESEQTVEPTRPKAPTAAVERPAQPAAPTPRLAPPLPTAPWDFEFEGPTGAPPAPVTTRAAEGFHLEEPISEAGGLGPLMADASPVVALPGPPPGGGSWLGGLPNALTPVDQSLPSEIPTAAGFGIDPEMRAFLDAWLHAAATRDYAGYRGLGFPDSPEFFDRTYVRWRDFRFARLREEVGRGEPGRRYVRAVLSYAFENPEGRWRTEDEHRLVLRATPEGLRYEARWK
jgi:hypothetical protein